MDWGRLPDSEAALLDWFKTARAIAPVHENPDTKEWHVLGYDAARRALSDHAYFSSAANLTQVAETSPFRMFQLGDLSWMDPPRHSSLRGLAQDAYTPAFVTGTTPAIRDVIDRTLAEVPDLTQAAFVDDIASPIAGRVIAHVFGIPETDEQMFRVWSKAVADFGDPTVTENLAETVAAATAAIKIYLDRLIAERRAAPGDDLISRLIAVERDGLRFEDAEIAGIVATLIMSGHTANHLLANSVICLDDNPEVLAGLRAGTVPIERFLEESMRFRSQTTRLQRLTLYDVEIGGQTIPAGRLVSVWLPAANRDPRAFSDPDRFDVARWPNPHLGLGHGAHYCLGASLARLEVSMTLTALFDRLAEVRIDTERSRLLDPRFFFGAAELYFTKA